MAPQDKIVPKSSRNGESIGNEAKNLIRSVYEDVKKGSTYKQMGFGASVGWLAGYLSLRVGKVAATTVGCSLLLVQIASHKGYINWKRVNEDVRRVQSGVNSAAPGALSDIRDFVASNKYIASGFAGGFLLGMSLS